MKEDLPDENRRIRFDKDGHKFIINPIFGSTGYARASEMLDYDSYETVGTRCYGVKGTGEDSSTNYIGYYDCAPLKAVQQLDSHLYSITLEDGTEYTDHCFICNTAYEAVK